MSLPCILVTQDFALQSHWQKALQPRTAEAVPRFADLLLRAHRHPPALVWLDLGSRELPPWSDHCWNPLFENKSLKLLATASNPKDDEAITALDAGCAGYCHAYATADTLQQVAQVVEAGHVWIGPTLMQRLIQGANRAAALVAKPAAAWSAGLTPREEEIAKMAANGASNQQIADNCGISERTVKAHLSAIFEKLGIADRLQLALKVHGISP